MAHRRNVTIKLRPVRGNYKMFASDNIDDGAPNGVNALWSTENHELNIYNNDPHYAKVLTSNTELGHLRDSAIARCR